MGIKSALRAVFGSRRPNRESIVRIKIWARAAAPSEEIAFAVNEIACNDPACPGVETVILVMEKGRKTRACKVPKMLEEVTEEDVRRALASGEA